MKTTLTERWRAVAGILAALVLSAGVVKGQVRIYLHGGCLQLPVNTNATVLIYNGDQFVRTAEQYNVLCPTSHMVPQTTNFVVPPNATQVRVGDEVYAVDPSRHRRTIPIQTGEQAVIVFERRTITSMVYVASNANVPPGTDVFIVPYGVKGNWVANKGAVTDDPPLHLLYVPVPAPRGIVYFRGVWQPHSAAVGHTTITITTPEPRRHHRRARPSRPPAISLFDLLFGSKPSHRDWDDRHDDDRHRGDGRGDDGHRGDRGGDDRHRGNRD